MTNNNSSNNTAKKPVYRKLMPGGITAAVFENEYEGRSYKSVNLQRSYKKGNDWKRMGIYLDHEHIPFMIEALKATLDYLNGQFGGHANDLEQTTSEPMESVATDVEEYAN